MSEDEGRKNAGHEEEQDEVEAHKRHNAANAEAKDEAAGDDDDFEAHRKAANL
jgi:hypothetical protein